MKKTFPLSVIAMALCSAAFANGVEKKHALPVDATNVQISAAELAWRPSGFVSNGGLEGTPDEATSSEAVIAVTVTYNSKDDSDVPTSGSGLDGQITSSDDARPQFTVFLKASDALVSAIEAGKTNAAATVSLSLAQEEATIETPVQYHCQYVSTNDGNSFEKADPSCEEASPLTREMRPVATIELR